MAKMDLGLQMWSIHDVCLEKGFEAVMKEIKPMGYNGFEFALGDSATLSQRCGFPVDPKELKRMMDHYGVKPIGSHVSLGAILQNPDPVLEECTTLELPYAAIGPAFYGDREPHMDQVEKIETIGRVARLFKKYGIQLQVHCAAYGYLLDYKGRRTNEGMFEDVGLEFLQPELDTAWMICGGVDPVEYLHRFKGFVDILHFKDFHPLPYESPYILVRHNTVADHHFGCAVGDNGVQDLQSIVGAARACGTQWVVTELWNEKNAMENARISADNLKKFL